MCPQTHETKATERSSRSSQKINSIKCTWKRLDQSVNISALKNMRPIPSPAGQLIARSTSRTKQAINSRKGELRNCHVAGQQYYYIWSEATDELRTWRSRAIQIWQVYVRILLYAEIGTWADPQVTDKERRKWGDIYVQIPKILKETSTCSSLSFLTVDHNTHFCNATSRLGCCYFFFFPSVSLGNGSSRRIKHWWKGTVNLPANFPSWSQTAALWAWLPVASAGFPSFSPLLATFLPCPGASLSNEERSVQLFWFTLKIRDLLSSCRAAGLDSLRLAALQKVPRACPE